MNETRNVAAACERKRERFQLLHDSGRLCGYRATTIKALLDGRATSEESRAARDRARRRVRAMPLRAQDQRQATEARLPGAGRRAAPTNVRRPPRRPRPGWPAGTDARRPATTRLVLLRSGGGTRTRRRARRGRRRGRETRRRTPHSRGSRRQHDRSSTHARTPPAAHARSYARPPGHCSSCHPRRRVGAGATSAHRHHCSPRAARRERITHARPRSCRRDAPYAASAQHPQDAGTRWIRLSRGAGHKHARGDEHASQLSAVHASAHADRRSVQPMSTARTSSDVDPPRSPSITREAPSKAPRCRLRSTKDHGWQKTGREQG